MKQNHYDYIIVGGGVSGLHLSHSFINDEYFKNHKILIIDNSKAKKQDNSFSFWEKGVGKWDSILENKWSEGKFHSKFGSIHMDFSDYKYKTLNSYDFSNFVKKKLKKNNQVKLINDVVLKIRKENKKLIIIGNKKNYYANHVFDSRPNKKFKKQYNNYTSLKQHFIGWVVRTKEAKFNKDSFVFMDYRIRDKNHTAFTYVLPFKENEALIEHTYFSKNECKKKVYENYIRDYMNNHFTSDYKVIKSEFGVIPMTSYPFYRDSTKNITKIGSAGGWIKPSTGYSFKNSEKNSLKILENIKKGKSLIIESKTKYKFLDNILLGVLSQYNHMGEMIFYKMIKKNKTKNVLRFLDEESSLLEDINIILSVKSKEIIKVFFQSFYKKAL